MSENKTPDKRETPRVNAVVPFWQSNEIIDLARQLERELANAMQINEQLTQMINAERAVPSATLPMLADILKAVDAEEEAPGQMPDEMWAAINGDRDATEEGFRVGIRLTKANIRERIQQLYVKVSDGS